MKKRILKNIEWSILLCTILLIAVGMVALFSATQNTEYEELKKQIMWLCISIPIVIMIICIDYDIIAKVSPVLYGIILVLLVAVLFTKSVNGATSWFEIGPFTFQPSEFAKIFVILVFALVVSKMQQRGREEISKPFKLLMALAIVAVPVLLIIKQPDYGTALAFLVATVCILFVAGIKKRYIIGSILLVALPYRYYTFLSYQTMLKQELMCF
ncbi:MAG: FtsW/RodA/SpoVE family cell cycle protein [Clostridia bacterium]